MRDVFAEESRCTVNYIVLVLASCALATFGLLENSAAVIIGAMLVAPLIGPIQALAFGAVEGQLDTFRRSLASLVVGTLLAVALSAFLEWIVALPTFGSEMISRSKPNVLDLGIALAAGAVCGFAKVRPAISSTVAGTAIAVALLPPLCVIGIALAAGQTHLALGATLLYFTNVVGITLSCMTVYMLAGYVPLRQSRRALAMAVFLTALIFFPLAASFVELLREATLETTMRTALTRDTQTFRHVQLVGIVVDWPATPQTATLTVRSTESITPTQVGFLQNFLEQRMKRRFVLKLEVTPLVEVPGPASP